MLSGAEGVKVVLKVNGKEWFSAFKWCAMKITLINVNRYERSASRERNRDLQKVIKFADEQ